MKDEKLIRIGIIAMLIGPIMWLGLFHSCNRYMGVEDDNPIEELIEDIIEVETGLDIDLTPE